MRTNPVARALCLLMVLSPALVIPACGPTSAPPAAVAAPPTTVTSIKCTRKPVIDKKIPLECLVTLSSGLADTKFDTIPDSKE